MIGLISDIHGNYTALMAVLKELDKMNVDEIYCLGDIVGYYTQVNECIDELKKRNVLCVLGNHDWYMVSNTNCIRSKSVNICIEYQRKLIKHENMNWLLSNPIARRINNLFIVHGGWNNPLDEYINPDTNYFKDIDGVLFASGHTHVQKISILDKKIYCNPGSVGQPRDNDPRASFAVIQDNMFQLHRVQYDISTVAKLMQEAGFDDYYYGSLYTGAKKLCKINKA